MTANTARKAAVALGVAAAILIPAIQQGLHLGLSQAEFAAQGDSTLRAAGYAFSIWGLIYLGLAAFAVHHWRARESRALEAIGWPAAFAAMGCGLWIVAAAADWMLATVVIILASAVAALVALLAAAPLASGKDRIWALVPVALLAGWLTVAAPLNVLTALTSMNLIGPGSAKAWAIGGVLVTAVMAILVGFKSRMFAYPLPTAWGLAAVYVAERARDAGVAFTAAGAAGALLAAALLIAFVPQRQR